VYRMSDEKATFVESGLGRYKTLTISRLLEYIPDREPRRYLYDLLPSYPTRPGKGLRPALCIATCRAFGGDIDHAVRTAVAIEMFHNAFLVHDDIADFSVERRGGSTLHREVGIPLALNVGDALQVMSITPLMENRYVLGPVLTWDVFIEIEHMVRQSVEGQAIELGWVHDNICDLTQQDYLWMTLKKTCWYTCIHPCRIGALIATAEPEYLDRFNRFAYFMGAAFQIRDDLLNLTGQQVRYGKEILGDVWEGKRTLMLIHLLNACTSDEKERLRDFLVRPRASRTERDVRWVFRRMTHYGSLAYARGAARDLSIGALEEFDGAYADAEECDDKRLVREIVAYMIERDL
jgi:geranylgeranyl diphosphate synthase, type II